MRTFWLFQATPDGLPRKRQAVFWVWNLGILLAAGLCLGWLSLFFAYGDYPDTIMKTYFQHPLILFLNIAPVCWPCSFSTPSWAGPGRPSCWRTW